MSQHRLNRLKEAPGRDQEMGWLGCFMSRPGKRGRDKEGLKRCRDPVLRSRPGLACVRSRPGFDIATWSGAGQEKRHRDLALVSRPGQASESAGAHPTRGDLRSMRPRPWRCARYLVCIRARQRAVCARPRFYVCALCTRPSFEIVHCLGSLFMDTIHEHYSHGFQKKQKKRVQKKLKNFLCMTSYMECLPCITYECIDEVCEIFFFFGVNSVLGLYLHP